MKVQVLQIRIVGKGLRIAHVKAGDLFGDVPAGDGVNEGQVALLKNSVRSIAGRLQSSLRVERIES